MTRHLVRRLLLLIPVIFGVITIAFFLMHLSPGDPARNYLGDKATQASVDALRQKWGLDQNIWLQYLSFLGNTVTGRLGTSLYFNAPITQLLAVRLPVTMLLMLVGTIFSVATAVPLALLTSTRGRAADGAVRGFNALVQGMPTFFIGSMLILFLGLRVRAFPAGGYGNDFGSHLYALVLPGVTVALGVVPLLVRSLNAAMREVLQSEYVAFGRSKGLDARRVMTAYVLRTSSISGVSILGIQVGAIAGGALVVEQVFALPGMGSMLMTGILSRDYPVVQACTLTFAVIVVLVYLATDLVYAALDPRARFS